MSHPAYYYCEDLHNCSVFNIHAIEIDCFRTTDELEKIHMLIFKLNYG